MDALNQLEDHDYARLLGWLPAHPFNGRLRLIVSTFQAIPSMRWSRALDASARAGAHAGQTPRMIADYLKRFGKKLDAHGWSALPPRRPPRIHST